MAAASPHPWRRLPGSARAPSTRALGSLVRELRKARARESLAPIRAGVEVAPTPELSARLAAALELIDHLDADMLAGASDRCLGDAERLVERATPSTLVHAVAAHLGLERALGMMVAAAQVRLDAGAGGWLKAVWLTDEPGHRRDTRIVGWEALRHAVCGSTASDYQAAVDWVVAHPSEDPVVQRRLAAAFPDEPWADELLAQELAGPTPDEDVVAELLVSCSRPVHADALSRVDHHARLLSDAAADLVAVWPADEVVPLLVSAMAALLVKPRRGTLFKTPPRRVAEALTEVGDEACAEAMASYLGHRVLGAQAARFFEAHPEHAEHVASRDPALFARLVPDDAGPVCREEEVPALLRDRGWRPVRHPEPVVQGLTWSLPVDIHYEPLGPLRPAPASRPMTEEELQAWRGASYRPCDVQHVHTRGKPTVVLEVPADEGLALWNRGDGAVSDEARWAARHGVDALAGFVAGTWARWLHEEYGRERLAVLRGMHTPEVVPAFVDLLHRKRWRATALRWLVAHPQVAAIGLVPAALGPRGAARKQAQTALVALADAGAAPVVTEVARGFGPAADEGIRQLLERPRVLRGKAPKLPDWLQVDGLPPPRVAGGALPPDAVHALVELMSLDPSAHGYVVDLGLEPDSVGAFVDALLATWVDHDAPGRHDWMLRAVLVFDVPTARRRVVDLFRGWAHRAKAKALRCVPVLEELGDERSLLALARVAHSSRIQAVKKAALEGLDRVAEDRGWSREELDDRTMPSLGLDRDGGMELGHRGVRARVTSELTVELRDAEGARLRALPRAGDNPEAHGVAKQRLAQLRTDVEAVATRQRQRLEAAMVSQRSWPLAEARRWLFEAPLLAGVVRSLVWSCDGVPFRVSEDGSFSDVHDEPVDIVEGRVMVVHPLRLAEVEAWSELLADYDCIQPFPQLGRPVYGRDEVLERVGPVPAATAMGRLESRGWVREGGGWVTGWSRGEATIQAEPGIEIAYLRGQEVHLVAGPTSVLDDVAFSELVHDLRSWG